jgi:hypothetical protein
MIMVNDDSGWKPTFLKRRRCGIFYYYFEMTQCDVWSEASPVLSADHRLGKTRTKQKAKLFLCLTKHYGT